LDSAFDIVVVANIMRFGVASFFTLLFVVGLSSVLGGDPSILRVVGNSKSRAIYGQCYLTATNADLLACVDISSGSLSWRFSLDENAFHDGKKVIAADKVAYVLSYSTVHGGASLYAVSIKDGSLLWTLPIPSGPSVGDAVDMTYNRKENSLYILLHNAFHKVSTSETEPIISTMNLDDNVLPGLRLLRLIDSTNDTVLPKRAVAVGCIQDSELKCKDSAVLQLTTATGDSTEVTKVKSSSKQSAVFASASVVYRVDVGRESSGKITVSLEQTSFSGSQQSSSVDFDFSPFLVSKSILGSIVPQFMLLDNTPIIHLSIQLNLINDGPMTLHAILASSEDGTLSKVFATSSDDESVLVSIDSIAAASQSIRQLQVFTNQPNSEISLLGGKIRVSFLPNGVLSDNSLVGLLKESEKTIIAEGGSRTAAFQVSPDGLSGKWFRQEALSQMQQAILLSGLTMKSSSSFFGALDAICARTQFAWAKPLCGVFDNVKLLLEATESALERILPTKIPHHRHGRKSTLKDGQDHVIAITFDGDAKSFIDAPVSINDLNLQLHSLVFPHDLAALKSLNGGSVEKSVLISSRRLVGASNGAALVRSVRLLTVPVSKSSIVDGTVSVRVIAGLVEGGVISWVTSFSLEDDMRSKLGDDYVPLLSDSSSAVSAAVKTLVPSELLSVDGRIAAVTSGHLITESSNADEHKISIVPLADNNNQQSQKIPQYVHTISAEDGVITIYESSSQRIVANVKFDPNVEKIVDVAFPVSEDLVYSRVSILGDDNILVKYLNPNMMVVCTAANFVESISSDGTNAMTPQVYLNLIDVVSGNVLQRVVVDSASVPVRAHLMENFVLLSYWNPVSKRAEILTIGLYDGVIGKTDYLPFASKPNVGSREHDEKATLKQARAAGTVQVSVDDDDEKAVLLRSSYMTSIPLVMQRTYLLPRKVMDIAHTLSRHGLTNKNILLTFESGEVYSLDFRILHPRRPISDPTASEREEGLMRYGPIFPFLPQMTLTMENNLRPTGRYPTKTLSAPSYLESAALVFVYGPHNDVLFTSVTPSQGFDTLSATFDYTALVGLISLLFVAVMILRRMHRKTTLKRMWQ
jgi:hypothetical protein